MPRGGKRLGAGRKGGTTNHTIKRIRGAMKIAASAIRQVIPDAFEGDAHALMVCVYKDPQHPIEVRLDAAKCAIRYEKPSLQAVEHTGANGGPIQTETHQIDETEAARRIAFALTKGAQVQTQH